MTRIVELKQLERLLYIDEECDHPLFSLRAWYAFDGTFCMVCVQCKRALSGSIEEEEIHE